MAGKILLILTVLTILAPADAAAQPTLEMVARENALASTRLLLHLSQPTTYRVQSSGQRVDILLAGADASAALRLPPVDDKIVKVLLARGRKELMVSFLLRQAPARVSASANRGIASVNVELFWHEGEGRPPIAFRVSGLPARKKGIGAVPPRLVSPYQGRWEDFFREYRTPLKLEVPLFFSVPPRPAEETGLGPDIDRLVRAGEWRGVLEALRKLPATADTKTRQLRALLRGEALLRDGRPAEALRFLEPLARPETPPTPAERTIYLYALAAATGGDPYMARYQMTRLAPSRTPWAPFIQLLRGEAALAVARPAEALRALEDLKTSWPSALQPLQEQRLADALAATNRPEAARAIYRRLLARPELLMEHPFSLRHCADSLAGAGELSQSAFLYGEVARKIPLGSDQGLAMVAAARAYEAAGERNDALTLYAGAWSEYPGSEAGNRARVRLLDMDVLTGDEMRRRNAEAGYMEVALQAPSRAVREEAAFKRALVLFLLGEKEQSVRLLLSFQRDFAAGPLRPEAGVLVRELVPSVVAEMVARGDDLKALVLVEQARDDLLVAGTNLAFLMDVAKASTRLGLFQRACRVYLFLLNAPGDEVGKEKLYLPLVELALLHREYGMAEEFGRKYLDRYPRGEDRGEVFLLLARTLEESGKLDKAAVLLKGPGRPRTPEVELFAADLFWRMKDLKAVAGCFPSLEKTPPRGALLKAEALCRIGRPESALPLFRKLLPDADFGDQAAFRIAEIEMGAGRRREGLDILKTLAEKGKDPQWRRLADETLAVEKL